MIERQLSEAYLAKISGRMRTSSLLDRRFPHQCAFIEDKAKLKAAFCTRRAAKSYTGGLYLTKTAEEFAGCNALFIGLTRLSAKGIVWKDILKDINKKHNLDMSFNGSELTATTRNGSIIYVTGADADEDEMEKLLGKKYKLVVIDEAASFSIDLRRLIYGILKPSTIDEGGTICLLGTSGNLTTGLFFDVTNNKEPGWSLHSWTAFDNPYVAKQWQEELDEIDRERPLFKETPLYRQWYLNEWVIDTDKLVYKINSDRNEYLTLPNYAKGEWQYVLGVDLGYEDASGFVAVAFHEFDKTLFIIDVAKQTKMDITDVANKIKHFQSRFPIFRVVIDGANKQAVEEIQKRHGIALTAADKTGKSDFIEIMNSEFIQGNIRMNTKTTSALKDEYLRLIWNEKALPKREEHPNCENHLTDAALYAWRYCYQFLSEKPKPVVDMRKPAEWIKHTEKLMSEQLDREINAQQEEERSNDFWNTTGLPQEDIASYFVNKRKQQ